MGKAPNMFWTLWKWQFSFFLQRSSSMKELSHINKLRNIAATDSYSMLWVVWTSCCEGVWNVHSESSACQLQPESITKLTSDPLRSLSKTIEGIGSENKSERERQTLFFGEAVFHVKIISLISFMSVDGWGTQAPCMACGGQRPTCRDVFVLPPCGLQDWTLVFTLHVSWPTEPSHYPR